MNSFLDSISVYIEPSTKIRNRYRIDVRTYCKFVYLFANIKLLYRWLTSTVGVKWTFFVLLKELKYKYFRLCISNNVWNWLAAYCMISLVYYYYLLFRGRFSNRQNIASCFQPMMNHIFIFFKPGSIYHDIANEMTPILITWCLFGIWSFQTFRSFRLKKNFFSQYCVYKLLPWCEVMQTWKLNDM